MTMSVWFWLTLALGIAAWLTSRHLRGGGIIWLGIFTGAAFVAMLWDWWS